MPFFKTFLYQLILGGLGFAASQSISKADPSLNVSWIACTDTNILGYKLYYGSASQQYTHIVEAGNTNNALISGVQPGNTYYFAATSYNGAGVESAYSPEVAYTVPVINAALNSSTVTSSGFNFSVNGTTTSQYVILASTDLLTWVALATNTAPFIFTDPNTSQFNQRYYQAVLRSMYVPQIAPTPPVVSPPLISAGLTASGYTFTVTNTVGFAYVVLASTDYVNWIVLATNTAPFTFIDNQYSQLSQRYYNVILESAYVAQIEPATPVVSPPLISAGLTASGYTFTVTNTVGSSYVIQASADFINWVDLATNTAPFTFTDTNYSQSRQEYYRATLLAAYSL